jgi:hypothetical protein
LLCWSYPIDSDADILVRSTVCLGH